MALGSHGQGDRSDDWRTESTAPGRDFGLSTPRGGGGGGAKGGTKKDRQKEQQRAAEERRLAKEQQKAAAELQRKLEAEQAKLDANTVNIGLAFSSEQNIRSALEGTSLDTNGHFVERLHPGQHVLAYYECEDEDETGWYEARVLRVHHNDLVDVIYVEYDEEARLVRGHVKAREHTHKGAKDNGGAGGANSRSRAHQAAASLRVPPKPAANPYKAQREALPVFSYRERILETIASNQVVVIEGDTGCGKSTQLPQYVLEAAAAEGRPCSVLCTQPRRISAMGVADRVAAERGERVGDAVGYAIRLESKTSAATCCLFCTTGILMRRLADEAESTGGLGGDLDSEGAQQRLAGVTHLFVDEVHERSMESDFLLMVLRDLLARRPDLRLILMSATLDANLFADYFAAERVKADEWGSDGDADPWGDDDDPRGLEMPTSSSRRGGRRRGGKGGATPKAADASTERSAASARGAVADTPRPEMVREPCPVISVPGRTFPVTTLFLEDAIELTSHRVRPRADWARKPIKGGGGGGAGGAGGANAVAASRGQSWQPQQRSEARVAPPPQSAAMSAGRGSLGGGRGGDLGAAMWGSGPSAPVDPTPDMALAPRDLANRYGHYSVRTQQALAELDHEAIDYELVVQLLQWLRAFSSDRATDMVNQFATERAEAAERAGALGARDAPRPGTRDAPERAPGDGDAVLVFLPGLKEIQTVHELLLETREYGSEPQRSWIVPLHSTLPPEEQRRVFTRPPPEAGVRKVVLATNIAETAITVDDVGFVIDCGRMKETRYDQTRRMESLEEVRVARANAKQRRGRAGRVRPGVAFHLFSRHAHECVMAPQQAPEVCRVPLARLVLTIKALRYPQTAAEVCANLIEPPSPDAVRRAILELTEIDALEAPDDASGTKEELTALGQHLAKLPVDVRIGKLLLLGAIFGVADEALTVAASLSFRTPFLSPFEKRQEADAARNSFRAGQSDHLTVLRAYREFDRAGQGRFAFARDSFLSVRTLQSIAQLKRQLLELLSEARFVRQGLRSRAVEGVGRRERGSDGCRSAIRNGITFASGGGGGDWRARPGPEDHAAAAPPPGPTLAVDEPDDLDGPTGELVKSLLCAALYPQLVVVQEPKGGGGSKGPKPPKLLVREEGVKEPAPVQVHPSSVNAKETRFSSKYLVYAEKVKTGMSANSPVYIRDCAPVSPFSLMLFAGELRTDTGARILAAKSKRRANPHHAETVLCVDWWIRFRLPDRLSTLILDTRERLEALLKVKIARPELEFSNSGRDLLAAVTELLATPGW